MPSRNGLNGTGNGFLKWWCRSIMYTCEFAQAVVKDYLTTAADGKKYHVQYYNLDVIISVGYRVKSKRGTQFRQWANQVLKDYLLRGYAINQRVARLEEKVAEHDKQIDFFVRTDDKVYHLGASLKDLGKKLFAFSKMETPKERILP